MRGSVLSRLGRVILSLYASLWLTLSAGFVASMLTPDPDLQARAWAVAGAVCLGLTVLVEIVVSALKRRRVVLEANATRDAKTPRGWLIAVILLLPIAILLLGQVLDAVYPFLPRPSPYSRQEESIFRGKAQEILRTMRGAGAEPVLAVWERDGVRMPSDRGDLDPGFLEAISGRVPATGYGIANFHALEYPRDGRELLGEVTFELEDGSQVTILLGMRQVDGVYRLSGFPSRPD
jgi:hypothetical protein